MDVQTPSLPTGLSQAQAEASRRRHGSNEPAPPRRAGFFRQFLSSFGDPVIRILLIALALNLLMCFRENSWFEALGIAAAVFLATFVSTLSEYGSEAAFLRLQAEAARQLCRVRRREGLRELPAGQIVVGDLVLLQAGERIPADGVLAEGSLRVDQSAVNGESREAEKAPARDRDPASWSPEDPGQLFSGCLVTQGQGTMLVRRVGAATLSGAAGSQTSPEAESPLKARLGRLAKTISRMGCWAAGLIGAASVFHTLVLSNGLDPAAIRADLANPAAVAAALLHGALLAIAVAVMAVPEGLPMMITVVLSANMVRMKRDHVMVRKLVGIETAGSLGILFTDKTGTLTAGTMAAEALILSDGKRLRRLEEAADPALRRLTALSCLCNNQAVPVQGRPSGSNGTDRALWDFAAGWGPPEPARMVLPFTSEKKFSCARLTGQDLLLFKGAPEVLLPRCHGCLGPGGRREPGLPAAVGPALESLTREGFRVLVLASGDSRETSPEAGPLWFLGLLGLADPLRPGVRQAVRQVHGAGIQTVMITGDNPDTAAAVARRAGLLTGGDPAALLTSRQLAALSDEALQALLPHLRVVARALPADKSRLIRAAQARGLVAGMTGDGVNDVPALKLSDVGFAMGSGSQAAREAGDIVILDDNFASIAKAIVYGRTIFRSIRCFLLFRLTMNLSAVAVSLLAPLLGVDAPLTVTQLLWINMIMDSLGGLAFAGEPPEDRVMDRPPVPRQEPLLTRTMQKRILLSGFFASALCLTFLSLPVFRRSFGFSTNYPGFLTGFFALYCFCGIFGSLSARTGGANPFTGLWKNPAFAAILAAETGVQFLMILRGSALFRTVPIPAATALKIFLLAALTLPADAAGKLLLRRRR